MMRFWWGRFWGFFIGIIFFACFGVGSAKADEEDKKSYLLDTVVVTAAGPEAPGQTGDVDTGLTPASVSIIRREAFEGKTENLAEVIEKEAGVQVRQSGGLGSFSSVSLRGSSSDQVMVYLDGILLNDASGGGVDLSTIALSDVQAIEVYRGITPINFGKASIGGVVNIRTLRSQKGFDAAATAGYGSFNTRKASMLINHKPGRWDYLLCADHLAADNDYDFLNDNGTSYNTADDRTEKRNNADVEQNNVLAKAGCDLTQTLRFDLLNQYFKKNQGLPSWNNSPDNQAGLDTARNITTVRLTANDLTPLKLKTRTQITYTWKEEEYDDRDGRIGLGSQHSTYETTRLGFDFFGQWETARQSLVVSLGVNREEYATEDHLKKSNPRDSSRDSFSIGLQDSIFLFKDTFIITPAARWTYLKDELESADSIWGTELDSQQREDSYLSPQIGLTCFPADWLTVRSNLAGYVREPSFFELFGDRGFFLGNRDLKKEKGVNFDLGLTVARQTRHPLMQKIVLTTAYFRSEVDDLITRTYDARGIGKSVNVSHALIQGVEAGASLSFLEHFHIEVNATWQDAQNQSEIQAFDGKQLSGRFEEAYRGRLEAHYGGFTAHVSYSHESGMYYDTANSRKAPDKKELNAGLSWTWRALTLTLEGRNLEDNLYEDFNGYPLPGRSFYASLKYSF